MTRPSRSAALRCDAIRPLTAARNNLALAFAAPGRMDLARTQFLDAGDRASGLYNTGIAYLASGDAPERAGGVRRGQQGPPDLQLSRERAGLIRARLGVRRRRRASATAAHEQ